MWIPYWYFHLAIEVSFASWFLWLNINIMTFLLLLLVMMMLFLLFLLVMVLEMVMVMVMAMKISELASVGWKIGAKPVSTSLPSPTINDASFYFFQGAPLQQSSFENKPFGIIVLVRRYSMWPVDFA